MSPMVAGTGRQLRREGQPAGRPAAVIAPGDIIARIRRRQALIEARQIRMELLRAQLPLSFWLADQFERFLAWRKRVRR